MTRKRAHLELFFFKHLIRLFPMRTTTSNIRQTHQHASKGLKLFCRPEKRSHANWRKETKSKKKRFSPSVDLPQCWAVPRLYIYIRCFTFGKIPGSKSGSGSIPKCNRLLPCPRPVSLITPSCKSAHNFLWVTDNKKTKTEAGKKRS